MDKKKFENDLADSVGTALDELESSVKKGGSIIAKVLMEHGGQAVQEYVNAKKELLKEKIKKGLNKDGGEE